MKMKLYEIDWDVKMYELIKNPPKMISLYDYLGKAGGSQLGAQLYEFAKKFKQPIGIRRVENPSYTGNIRTYHRDTIKLFFELRQFFTK